MKRFLIVVALCTVCAAFLPLEMERHALNAKKADSSSTNEPPSSAIICAPQTPCAWITYNPVNRVLEDHINNTYCICAADKACKAIEDDRVRAVFTLYCRDRDYDDTELLDS